MLDIACFHCHQAIEKFLKAFLISRNKEIQYTHNLDFLIAECSLCDPNFKDVDIKDLNLYAVRARYPHDYIAPDISEANEYYELANDIKHFVLSKIDF